MSNDRWNAAPYLDALRPDFGWKVEYALLASYSADLVVVVAAMLALAGVDDDRGSGSKIDFATAIERLGGRFRLLIQSGRLMAPRKTPKILGLLDQFIRPVAFDESKQSWHPKIALVKTQSDDAKEIEWRLWIGSRNLTRDLSWDVGMTLVGRSGGEGKRIEGLIELAQSLATRSELTNVTAKSIASELSGVRWRCPQGCDIDEILLHDDGQRREFPDEPAGLKNLLVVSPFLDGTTVKRLSTWGGHDSKRTLLSSKVELLRLASQKEKPLNGFQDLLMMASPDPDDVTAAAESTSPADDSEDEEPEPRGLHAKVIVAEHDSGTTMWVGSANATGRGWNGPNAEVIAKVGITADVLAGVMTFINQSATIVHLEELNEAPQIDEEQDRLEEARAQVAAGWSVLQTIDDSIPILTTATDPNPFDTAIQLEVASLGGHWSAWPRGNKQLRMPAVSLGDVTELLACRLSLGDRETVWLQLAPINPAPGVERDRQALSRYLDPRTFLQWLRFLLVGTAPGDGGGSWDGAEKGTRRTGTTNPDWWSPTLEEILKAWGRDPASLHEVDRKAKYYLELYRRRDPSEITSEERKVVTDFEQVWSTIRAELVATR